MIIPQFHTRAPREDESRAGVDLYTEDYSDRDDRDLIRQHFQRQMESLTATNDARYPVSHNFARLVVIFLACSTMSAINWQMGRDQHATNRTEHNLQSIIS